MMRKRRLLWGVSQRSLIGRSLGMM